MLCKICQSPLKYRAPSRRPGEILLICEQGHKWQARRDDAGNIGTPYRVNYPGMVGERRKQVAVTASEYERDLMRRAGVKPQAVWLRGITALAQETE